MRVQIQIYRTGFGFRFRYIGLGSGSVTDTSESPGLGLGSVTASGLTKLINYWKVSTIGHLLESTNNCKIRKFVKLTTQVCSLIVKST